jgi:glycosyltransferase involved in cell wall biosynthesis
MRLELLISALKADPDSLIKTMGVTGDAVLINQCDCDSYCEIPSPGYGNVRVFSCTDRGVGTSRNTALSEAHGDILLFSDDDIVYEAGYENLILAEFNAHPEADGIFFNVDVDPSRRTYHTDTFGPVTMRASGRYPTYSLAIKRDAVKRSGVKFSTLFGGGARYSCGEDSLFIVDCLKNGLKLFKSPVLIGREVPRESTWFKGYTKKFFFDRGVLYHFLYGKLAYPLGVRFILKHKAEMCQAIPPKQAIKLIRSGIKEGREVEKKEGRI